MRRVTRGRARIALSVCVGLVMACILPLHRGHDRRVADRFRVEQKRRREGLRLKYGHAITTLSQSVTPPGHRHPRDWHELSAAAPHHRAGRAGIGPLACVPVPLLPQGRTAAPARSTGCSRRSRAFMTTTAQRGAVRRRARGPAAFGPGVLQAFLHGFRPSPAAPESRGNGSTANPKCAQRSSGSE